MGPGSFHRSSETGQGQWYNTETRISTWRWEKSSLFWEWQGTGTDSVKNLRSHLLQRCSKPTWIQPWAICFRWIDSIRGIRLDISRDPFQSQAFRDSVILVDFCNVITLQSCLNNEEWLSTVFLQAYIACGLPHKIDFSFLSFSMHHGQALKPSKPHFRIQAHTWTPGSWIRKIFNTSQLFLISKKLMQVLGS